MKWVLSFTWLGLLLVSSAACAGNKATPVAAASGDHSDQPVSVPVHHGPQQRAMPDVEEEVIRLVEEGHVSEAQQVAKRSAVTGSKLVRLEGILAYATGQADAALVSLSRAHATDPRDPWVALLLAEVQCWKSQTRKAALLLATVSDSVAASSSRPWTYSFHRARVLGWLGRYEDAEGQYRKSYNSPGAALRVRILSQVGLAEIAAWRKQYDDALRIVGLALADSPGSVEAILMKGQIQEWQGHYREARRTYTRALQLSPGLTELSTRLEKLSWVK